MPDPVPQELEAALQSSAARRGRLGVEIHYFTETGSTNDVAAALADGGSPEGTLVVASSQTAGRGRLGRRWHSPPDAGLYVSLIVRNPSAAPVSDARRRRGRGAGNHARDSAACSNQVAERHHRARQCATISAAQARRDPCGSIFWRRRPHLRHPRLWHQPQDDGVSAGTERSGDVDRSGARAPRRRGAGSCGDACSVELVLCRVSRKAWPFASSRTGGCCRPRPGAAAWSSARRQDGWKALRSESTTLGRCSFELEAGSSASSRARSCGSEW